MYKESLEEIINFCMIAKNGIAVAEINDLITCEEFIEDIGAQFHYEYCKLSNFSFQHLKEQEKSSDFLNDKILVIDELQNDNVDEIVVNLNYNRDWLLDLNRKIIIIIPSVTVSHLISYSNNFWSCVTVHKSFYISQACTIKPYLFDDGTHQYETKQENLSRHRIQKNVLGSSFSVSEIVNKTLNVQVSFSKNLSLLDWLSNYCKKEKNSHSSSIQKRIFLLGLNFYQCELYSKAQACYICLLNEFRSSLSNRQIFEARYMLGNTFYQQKNYEEAVRAYNGAIKVADCNEDFSQSKIPTPYLAKLLNNLGVSLYKTNIVELFDTALSYLDHAANNLKNDEHKGDLIWVLFNLSLISHEIGDLQNALYYVESAIKEVPTAESRIGKVISARFDTLRAYLLSNYGCISCCTKILSASLDLLRDELIEQHLYIMDVHFVYASVFLQANDLNHALHCAEKAEKISKCLSVEPLTKLKIWILLGEIHFYLKNYSEAKKYLGLAGRRSRNMLSSKNITEWINQTLIYCNEQL